MTGQKKLCLLMLCVAVLASWGCSQSENSRITSPSSVAASAKPFLGRWDLTVTNPAGEHPSWIQISEEQGQVKGLMVGFFGHATPTGKIEIKDGEISFAAPGDEGFSNGAQFKGKLAGGELAGTVTNPKGVSWQWTGRRAPTLETSGTPKWGKPIRLFNGRNFAGWKFSNPKQSNIWKVVKGTMVKNGTGSDIITTSKFKDFKLHVEFKCGSMANSGVFLRGRYEVQIETDSATEPPSHHTGGVYGFLAPHPEQPRRSGVWQSFDIRLVGRTVTVVQNGKTIIDDQEMPGITGGALDSNEGEPGPIYLQGSEKGRVGFRNIVITPAE